VTLVFCSSILGLTSFVALAVCLLEPLGYISIPLFLFTLSFVMILLYVTMHATCSVPYAAGTA
jgi:hypothetical protein